MVDFYKDLFFNISGSPFTCVAMDGVTLSGLKTALPANKLTTFTIDAQSATSSEFTAVVDITSKRAIAAMLCVFYKALN